MRCFCVRCGSRLLPGAACCSTCWKPLDAAEGSEKKGLFQLPGISITAAIIKINRKTYQLAKVAGFQIQERVNTAAKWNSILFIVSVVSGVCSLAQFETNWPGLPVSIVTGGLAVYCAIRAAAIYDLVVTMESGEVATYSWKNPKLTGPIRAAIAGAIAGRSGGVS